MVYAGAMTLDLNTLAKTSYAIASEKGWWNAPRSFAALTLLMQSEVSEALEDYRNHKGLNEVYYEVVFKTGNTATLTASELASESAADPTFNDRVKKAKPCGIPIELADFVIRVADFAGWAKFDLNEAIETAERLRKEKLASGASLPEEDSTNFELSLGLTNLEISLALRHWTLGDKDFQDKAGVPVHLVESLRHLFATCKALGIEIEKAIEEKAAFNKGRDFRHGGKKI